MPRLERNCGTIVDKLNIEGPWCSIGDYNFVLSDDEVFSKRKSDHHRSAGFTDWIFNQAMIDMGFEGSKFTWTRGLSTDTYKSARLDRGLCNLEWKDMFPEAKVIHLPIIQSDHAPLLIKLNDKKNSLCRGSFRFQAAWLTHEEFPKVIRKEWDGKENMEENIVKMANVLSDWNKSTFGNIHKNKRKLMARIERIQRSMNKQPNRGLLKLEKKLKKNLDKVLVMDSTLTDEPNTHMGQTSKPKDIIYKRFTHGRFRK